MILILTPNEQDRGEKLFAGVSNISITRQISWIVMPFNIVFLFPVSNFPRFHSPHTSHHSLFIGPFHRYGVGRGAAVGRARGVGPGDGLPSQDGAHKKPSLYWSRVSASADTSLGARYPVPIGGITKSPINASASAIVCWIQLASAPLAMFSFAAIN
jgi:hypothetical protein